MLFFDQHLLLNLHCVLLVLFSEIFYLPEKNISFATISFTMTEIVFFFQLFLVCLHSYH